MEHSNNASPATETETPVLDAVLLDAAAFKAKSDEITRAMHAEIEKIKEKFGKKLKAMDDKRKALLAAVLARRAQEDKLLADAGLTVTRERVVLSDDAKGEHDRTVLAVIEGSPGCKWGTIQAACGDMSESHIRFALTRLRERGMVATTGNKVATQYFPAVSKSAEQPSA